MTSDGASGTARWHELVDELRAQVPDLAQQYVGRVRGVPGYEPESSLVSDEDLLSTATVCITELIDGIRRGHADERLSEAAAELGRRRAFQRVPAESVAIAMQLDFGVIWGRLLELCGPRDAVVLTAHVEPTWRTVDEFTAAVMSSYKSETSRITQREANLRQATLGRLFAAAHPHESLARAVAFEIGCDPAAQFTVAVVDQSDSQDRLASAIARRAPHVFTHRLSGTTVVFWASESPSPLVLEQERIRAARARDVRGLSAVPSTARTLLGLLEATDPLDQRVVDLERSVPLLARRALANDEVDLSAVVDDRLAACNAPERARIVETLETFFDTGSVQQTADRLFCHRNTVLNRLSRFAELTGLDVTIPRDAATAMIALGHPATVVPPTRPTRIVEAR